MAKRARRRSRKKHSSAVVVAGRRAARISNKEMPLLDLFAVKDFIRKSGLTVERVAAAIDAIRRIENEEALGVFAGALTPVSQRYPSPETPKGWPSPETPKRWIGVQGRNDVLLTQQGRRRVRLADGRTASKREVTVITAKRGRRTAKS